MSKKIKGETLGNIPFGHKKRTSIGNSKQSRPKNKNRKKNRKKYRGQGK
jgi:hypothetical protein